MSVSVDSSSVSNEKTLSTFQVEHDNNTHVAANELGDHGAHVVDINHLGAEGQGLQTAKDGCTVLIPQPSSDPHDPLNWNTRKKHVILAVISAVAFMPDFGSSVGVVTLLPQAM